MLLLRESKMHVCHSCGFQFTSESVNFCSECGSGKLDSALKLDHPEDISRYQSFVQDLFFDNHESEVEALAKPMRERLKISHFAHSTIFNELRVKKTKIAHLFNFKLEFDKNVQDAFAGHDTLLKFKFTNLSDADLFKFTLFWQDAEIVDSPTLNIQSKNYVKPKAVIDLAGAYIFQRIGMKEISELIVTIFDQYGDKAVFRASPFSFKISNPDQRVVKNISTHNQISIEGRGVIDAAGMGADNNLNRGEDIKTPQWTELKLSCLIDGYPSSVNNSTIEDGNQQITQFSPVASEAQDNDLKNLENSISNFTGTKTVTRADGSVYQGEFLNGLRQGRGICNYPEGFCYDGDWLNDKATGQGKYTNLDGSVYVGGFLNGFRSGKGKETLADGRIYDGQWADNQKNGKGVMTWTDGDRYEGQIKDDNLNGFGKIYRADGGIYEGNFVNGEYHGLGTYYHPDGDVYEGEFSEGVESGQAKYSFADPDYPDIDDYDSDEDFNEACERHHEKSAYHGGSFQGIYLNGSVYTGDFLDCFGDLIERYFEGEEVDIEAPKPKKKLFGLF